MLSICEGGKYKAEKWNLHIAKLVVLEYTLFHLYQLDDHLYSGGTFLESHLVFLDASIIL
jgi:hypothetical protein